MDTNVVKHCVIETCGKVIEVVRLELAPQAVTCCKHCSQQHHRNQVLQAAKRAYQRRKKLVKGVTAD